MSNKVNINKVNQIEDALRTAQNAIEEAGRCLCSDPGDTVGGYIWRECTNLSEKIATLIHLAYAYRDPIKNHIVED